MSLSAIQLPKSPVSYELSKQIIDPRVVPICVEHIHEFGTITKTIVYYHNYGSFLKITIMKFPPSGEPQIKTYIYPIIEPRSQNSSNAHQYVV